MTIGIRNTGPGIGDRLQFSSLPENYFLNTGDRLVDLDKCWIFDYNPFVLRDVPHDKQINLWHFQFPAPHQWFGQADKICKAFNLPRCLLRHSRLYRFEEFSMMIPRRIVVHTNGISAGGEIPDHVINHIEQTYKGWEIIQVGGRTDRKTPFVDKCGLSMWETTEIIASAQIFIGVNSAMMNIANCYPRVQRKLVFTRTEEAQGLLPMTNSDWVDYNWSYFNTTPEDMGVTYSYLKL